jgi:hypothetical protein
VDPGDRTLYAFCLAGALWTAATLWAFSEDPALPPPPPAGSPRQALRFSARSPATTLPTNSWYAAGTPLAIDRDGVPRKVHVNKTPPSWEPPAARKTDPVLKVYVWDRLGGEPMEIELRSPKAMQFFKVESRLEVGK